MYIHNSSWLYLTGSFGCRVGWVEACPIASVWLLGLIFRSRASPKFQQPKPCPFGTYTYLYIYSVCSVCLARPGFQALHKPMTCPFNYWIKKLRLGPLHKPKNSPNQAEWRLGSCWQAPQFGCLGPEMFSPSNTWLLYHFHLSWIIFIFT